ncbi:hypothetical protein QUF58_10545 [Anaerolineales bacterium HSG24]|nr:hypothetical protein [Anaerolineales bacterium HSG24]
MKRTIPFAILAVIILVEHFTLGRCLKNWELTRWAIGILTVLGWSYPIALEEYGAYGEDIWQIIATGFAVAGTIRVGMSLVEKK